MVYLCLAKFLSLLDGNRMRESKQGLQQRVESQDAYKAAAVKLRGRPMQ